MVARMEINLKNFVLGSNNTDHELVEPAFQIPSTPFTLGGIKPDDLYEYAINPTVNGHRLPQDGYWRRASVRSIPPVLKFDDASFTLEVLQTKYGRLPQNFRIPGVNRVYYLARTLIEPDQLNDDEHTPRPACFMTPILPTHHRD